MWIVMSCKSRLQKQKKQNEGLVDELILILITKKEDFLLNLQMAHAGKILLIASL